MHAYRVLAGRNKMYSAAKCLTLGGSNGQCCLPSNPTDAHGEEGEVTPRSVPRGNITLKNRSIDTRSIATRN